MAWSGGLFGRVHSWGTDKINGILVLASRMDAECDNFRQGIEDTLHKGGQNSPTANLPMAGFKHTGVGNATARDSYASAGQVQDGLLSWVASGGSVDNITATYSPPITALVDGMVLRARATGANAGTAPVFSPSGLTAHPITKFGGQALLAGDIFGASHELILQYNLANTRWELLNPVKVLGVGNDVVGFAQLANIATDSLIGRDTAGTGDPEAITLDATLEFTGAGVIRRAALTGDITAPAGSSATTLANSGISAATYGSATQVAQVAFDSKGRGTSASNVSIQIAESQVTGLVTDLSNKQPLDAELTALAALTSAADSLPYFTGSGTAALTTLSSFIRTLLDDANVATARSTLGLAIGTDVQAFDQTLTALAAADWVLNSIPVGTGANTLSQTAIAANQFLARSSSGNVTVKTITDFALSFLDDADAATVATTLAVLSLSGGTLTGPLTLSADPSNNLHAASKQYVDAIGSGITVHSSVALATTANITLSGEQTIDGTLTSATRILVKNQTTTAQNGPYVTAAGAWTRATDGDTAAENPRGSYYFVTGGSTQGSTGWIQTSATPTTLGTDPITFQQFSAAPTFTASSGVQKVGNDFSGVVVNTARLTVGASGFDLATTAVTAASYGSASAVATFTVDAYGRLTLAATTSIAIAESQVTNLVSDLAGKQASDAELTAIAGLTSAADRLPYFTGSGTASLATYTAFARTLDDDPDAITARATLGLTIGTNVQAFDATLSALAAADWVLNSIPIGTGADTLSQTNFAANTFPARSSSGNLVAKTITDFGLSLVDDADATAAKTTLGLVIGTNVQAFDQTLTALAAADWVLDSIPVGTGANTLSQVAVAANQFLAKSSAGAIAAKAITDFGLSLVDDADATTARTTLGLVIGTNVQAFDAELAALAGLTSAADTLPYFTGSGTASTTTLSSFMRTVLDDTSAATAAATLSVLALSGGTLTGELILADVNHVSTLASGFRGVPVGSTQTGNYTFALTDSGKGTRHNSASAGHTFTIDGSLAWPVGAAVTIINLNGSASLSLAITTDTLRRGDGTAGSGTRTIAANSIVTAWKEATGEWYVSGSGLS